MTSRRSTPAGVTAAPRSRDRSHSLAPEHLGDARAVGAVVLAVIGTALAISALAIIISSLTLAARYTPESAPPNAGSLGVLPAIGGVGLLVMGAALAAASVATLLGARGMRPVSIALGVVVVAAGLAASLAVTLAPLGDTVTAASLFAVSAAAAVGAFLLARRRI